MYWKVRKITPDLIFRRYGVHAILIVSALFNVFLFTKVNASKAMGATQKLDYDKFVRQVTGHLFDANYLTYEDSMVAMQSELGPNVQQMLQSDSTLPKNAEDMKGMSRQLAESKSVSCVRFERVEVGQPDSKGFLPVDVKMSIAVHDAQGVQNNAMKLKYFVGSLTNPKTQDSRPIIVDLRVVPNQ